MTRCEARRQARTTYEKDLVYRQWNAEHDGVYVWVTPDSPPSPYLDIPARVIKTENGKELALVKPPWIAAAMLPLLGAGSAVPDSVSRRSFVSAP